MLKFLVLIPIPVFTSRTYQSLSSTVLNTCESKQRELYEIEFIINIKTKIKQLIAPTKKSWTTFTF